MRLPQHDFSTPSICCLACKDILVHRIVLPYLSSTLSIHNELNMQNPWKIRSAGGFWEITGLPRTLHKGYVSQKAHENGHFLIPSNG